VRWKRRLKTAVSLKDECEKKVAELNRLRAELKELKNKQQQSKHVIKLSERAHFDVAFFFLYFCISLVQAAAMVL
jgi:Skp family chaperone for outer membrane proteins